MKAVKFNQLSEDLKDVVRRKLAAVYDIDSELYDYDIIDKQFQFYPYNGTVIVERIIN